MKVIVDYYLIDHKIELYFPFRFNKGDLIDLKSALPKEQIKEIESRNKLKLSSLFIVDRVCFNAENEKAIQTIHIYPTDYITEASEDETKYLKNKFNLQC